MDDFKRTVVISRRSLVLVIISLITVFLLILAQFIPTTSTSQHVVIVKPQEPFSKPHYAEQRSEATILPAPWENTPRLSIMTRMYAGSAAEYWQVLAMTYLLFFPWKHWKNSDLVLVLDDEATADHQIATVLSVLPPFPKIHFEPKPPDRTLCSSWRNEGYSRQIYSTYNLDKYTDADYIGICDTDSYFATNVVVEDLFVNGKPRLIAYNGKGSNWRQISNLITDGPAVGKFMVVIGFPFMVKRVHLKAFREHVTKKMEKSTFEEAYHKICSTGIFSQYDLLGFYLFKFHRNDYSWHIRDQEQAKHPALGSRMTSDAAIMSYNKSKMGVMKHAGDVDHGNLLRLISDYVCTAADFKLGHCRTYSDDFKQGIEKSVNYNLMTDWTVATAYWKERHMPRTPMIHGKAEILPPDADNSMNDRKCYLTKYNGSWVW